MDQLDVVEKLDQESKKIILVIMVTLKGLLEMNEDIVVLEPDYSDSTYDSNYLREKVLGK